MIYLILAICVSCVMGVVYKVADVRRVNSDAVTLVNYMFASASSILSAASLGALGALARLGEANPAELLTKPSVPNTALYCLIFGAIFGCVYLGNFLTMKTSIHHNGVGITTFFGKSGFLPLIVIVMLVWREFPTAREWIGMALSMCALLMLTGSFREIDAHRPALLFVYLMGSGIVELNSKMFALYGLAEYKTLLLAVIFPVALIGCCVYVAVKYRASGERFRIGPRAWLLGAVLGVSNVLSTVLQMKCLESLSTAVVFPSIAAGNLLLSVLIGKFIFGEATTARQWIATAITMVSLVLING